MNKQTPINRLNYQGDLYSVIERLCDAYQIGQLVSFSIIEIGYEDCNVTIQTPIGKYLAKIFSKDRSPDIIERYSTMMSKAINAGVNHPHLIRTNKNQLVWVDDEANGISMILMNFIDGKTFFDLDRSPDLGELKEVIQQAVLINKIDYHPSYLFDSWAISNIQAMFERVKQFIQPEDINLVEEVIAKYLEIPTDRLPHCFVHGDFTKTNILKGDDNKIYVLDFSVSNWYPRIQELAVIAANLLYDKSGATSLKDATKLIADEYNALNPLTAEERQYLYPYSLAAVAMEFMGGHQEKYIKGNDTQETEFWLNLGRTSLQRELSGGTR